jgi:iron-sulfur cluster assembly protein
MGISLTESAAKEIQTIIDNGVNEESFDVEKVRLRVGVKGGGCSGFSYILDLTETDDDSYESFTQNGVTIVCDAKSYLYLNGTEIDFHEDVMQRGFVFKNPNATNTCGCGSSFSA